ncbi:hypothetical protein [Ktedonospora formicarum]|uniref:Uncharacterized protein n=1 Tax=Ktedonospora formicarum TaxID=2778364 RepID=A0A8J3I5G5_9CHLR|nr:hypothetical protein [Ktedonospora formicarum]GHO47085.1 hypothetical protein KSX_52480 [Ktedonospora formicarum]
MENEKNSTLLYGVIVATVVALLLSLYYLIPNINHIPIPAEADPTLVHYKYVELFGSLAVLGVIGTMILLLQRLARRKR